MLWGQTRTFYVDLRIPSNRPPTRGRRSFADFSLDELLRLADQKGFAGHVLLEGDLCSWIRYIDYRPSTGRPDRGRLRLEGETLYEEGHPTSVLGSAYQEIFKREHRANRRSVALRRLAADGGGAIGAKSGDAILVMIDDRFLFARGRAAELPAAESLRDLILSAGEDREAIHTYLDCDLSIGGTEGSAAWVVDSSTIPFREGRHLLPRATVELAEEPGMLTVTADEGTAHWQVVESTMPPGELARLLAQASVRDR
ncbi:MAG: hypothetical protein WEC00_13535 [Dongiaceae bacterium]